MRIYANTRAPLVNLGGGDDGGNEEVFRRLYEMRRTASGMDSIRKLTGAAWTHWLPMPGHTFPGVRARMLQYAQAVGEPLERLEKELADDGDAALWGDPERRVTGVFIAIEQREEGTVLLRPAAPATANMLSGAEAEPRPAELYLVSGIADGLAEIFARKGSSMPVGPIELTLLPWGGRWLYDGLMFSHWHSLKPGKAKQAVETARALESAGELRHTPPPPSKAQQERLKEAVRAARFDQAADDDDEPEEPLDEQTKAAVESLAALPAIDALPPDQSHRDASTWVTRRMGYTEAENPNHMLMVLAPGLFPGMPAMTAALDPTAAELLQIVADRAADVGRRPAILCVDCAAAVAGVAAALRGLIEVHYYPPPSAEEAAAAQSGIRPGQLGS